jgi:hypothetical protein
MTAGIYVYFIYLPLPADDYVFFFLENFILFFIDRYVRAHNILLFLLPSSSASLNYLTSTVDFT